MKRAAVKAFCERQRTVPGLLDAMITRTDNPHDGPFETVELMLLVQALQKADYVAGEAGGVLGITPRKMSYLMAKHMDPERHYAVLARDPRRRRKVKLAVVK